MPFRPGEIVELRGQKFRVAATNYDGKLILHPIWVQETSVDMMTRLQSTTDGESVVRVSEVDPPAARP